MGALNMSSYREFLEEKEKIDDLIGKGYQIAGIRETLSGAFVEFAPSSNNLNMTQKVELHILTADARKYFSNILVRNLSKLSLITE
jgi:hypothetical protein